MSSSTTNQIAYFDPSKTGVPVPINASDVRSIDKSDIPAFENSPASYQIVISFISGQPTARLDYGSGLVRRNKAYTDFMTTFGEIILGS